ncbi:hypothetical protein [Nocardia iowensis]|uniref:Uncharacterized protein n=1 Tax=Nocardia iowensis TaxID=204891 RepID=A0ABX8RZZ4_NOCIO|nr:hypothetical protein [Nocardia iowensis]QXN94414.1 hypothetical protein KV110_15945 [Nocardia iowensis]
MGVGTADRGRGIHKVQRLREFEQRTYHPGVAGGAAFRIQYGLSRTSEAEEQCSDPPRRVPRRLPDDREVK